MVVAADYVMEAPDPLNEWHIAAKFELHAIVAVGDEIIVPPDHWRGGLILALLALISPLLLVGLWVPIQL